MVSVFNFTRDHLDITSNTREQQSSLSVSHLLRSFDVMPRVKTVIYPAHHERYPNCLHFSSALIPPSNSYRSSPAYLLTVQAPKRPYLEVEHGSTPSCKTRLYISRASPTSDNSALAGHFSLHQLSTLPCEGIQSLASCRDLASPPFSHWSSHTTGSGYKHEKLLFSLR